MATPDFPKNGELRPGSLSVVRPAVSGAESVLETFIKITADGSVMAFNGHVDLGTGIRTALGQIVAEELDVSFASVVVVLGDTSRVPNQGATIASETIQISAVPLRSAAAQARQFLIARAAERLELAVEDLAIEDGLIRGRDNRSISYGELIAGESIRLELADNVPLMQEMIKLLNNRPGGYNACIKLDMMKAFDRVSWAFLNSLLLKFGFHGKFVYCIMKNLSNAWFSVLINGKPVGFFTASRGIK
jgi:hypothetical protein